MNKVPRRGYAALISVLVLSAVLTTLAFAAALEGSFARSGTLDGEYGAEARGLSDACVRWALLRYAEDPSFRIPASGTVLHLAQGLACTVDSLEVRNDGLTVQTHARSGAGVSARKAEAVVGSSSPSLIRVTDFMF